MAPDGIRPALIDDAGRIAELITELGYPTTTGAMCERLVTILGDPTYVTFVADGDRGVVGVAGASLDRYYEKDGVYSRLVLLAVSSTARGEGVGHQLLDAIERWSACTGAREVVVNSGVHRGDAHCFYEKCGYTRTGLRFVKRLDSPGGKPP